MTLRPLASGWTRLSYCRAHNVRLLCSASWHTALSIWQWLLCCWVYRSIARVIMYNGDWATDGFTLIQRMNQRRTNTDRNRMQVSFNSGTVLSWYDPVWRYKHAVEAWADRWICWLASIHPYRHVGSLSPGICWRNWSTVSRWKRCWSLLMAAVNLF